MKKLLLSTVMLIYSLNVFGQKVDIDNLYITISNARLPLNYIPAEDRNFRVSISGNSNMTGVNQEENIYIYGWDKATENPKIQVNVTLGSFIRGRSNLGEKVEEKKDKDGKVISTTKKYHYYATNKGMGSVRIFGKKNELPRVLSEKELERQKKQELKEQEKQAKKEKEKADNPFLSKVAKGQNNDNDDPANRKDLAYYWDFDKDYSYSTSEYTTSSAALKEYNENSGRNADAQEAEFRESYAHWVRSELNRLYGYSPNKMRVKFKRLDSKKHFEYENFENATQAMKVIFEKMRYNKPVDEIAQDMEPIIDYFKELTQKYASDDKQEIKLREACIYNLARIHQYLDQHNKTIDFANKLYDLDKKSKDAKRFIEDSTEIQRRLDFHQMKSRHIVPMDESSRKDELGEETESEEED